MELKDFIAATLVQLIEGVVAATPRAQELGAFINPADTLSTNYGGKPHSPAVEIPGQGRDKRFLQMVEFDVAILVKESTQAKGGAGLLTVVTLGASRESGHSLESTSRIKFSIPVALPLHKGISMADRAKDKPAQPPA